MASVPIQLPLFPKKVCTKCGEPKLLDEFYVADKATGRRKTRCKPCHNEQVMAHQRASPARYAAYARQRRKANPEQARARDAAYRERNREALNARDRERNATLEGKARRAAVRAAHAEQRRQYNARYREEHHEERLAYNREYYQKNKGAVSERIREFAASNPDKYRQIHTSWKRRNKDKVNSYGHKRRALEKANGGTWDAEDWQRLKAQCDWRCVMCGRQEITDGITLCFDHVVPISLGGFNIISNGQPCCRSCNSKKHRKVMDLRPDFLRPIPKGESHDALRR